MKYFYLIFLFFSMHWLHSQQLPFFRSEFYSPQVYNPSSFGTWNNFSVNTSGQFIFLQTDKVSNSFNVVGDLFFPISTNASGIGSGLIYFFDQVGFSKTHSVGIPINFQSSLGKLNWSIGATTRMSNINIDPDWIPPNNIPDPNLPEPGSQTKLLFDFGAMLYQQQWYFGFSTAQINAPLYNEISYQSARHFFMHGGYRFKVSENLQLFPSVVVGYDGATTQYQGAFLAQFLKPGISFGVGYGRQRMVSGILSYEFKKINFTWQTSSNFIGNSSFNYLVHEFRLSYRLQKPFGCSSCQKRKGRYECEHDQFL